MEINIPQYVKYVLDTLESNGFEAFCVGGAVRDLILGKTPYDFDITTSAEPETVIGLFPKTVPTGIKHGTVTVVAAQGNVEVTTYRTENTYSDHRAPDSVNFVKSIDEDVKRRDFTVNSVCYNPKIGFYDPENGINDIKSKTVRAIGNPDLRFNEDALRIMRAFRFSAQLGFEIEENTKASALKAAKDLEKISAERIFSELKKILLSDYPENAQELLLSGCLEFLGLPKLTIPLNLSKLPKDFSLRFAYISAENGFQCDIPLKSLKSDNRTIANSVAYSKLLALDLPTTKQQLKHWLMDTDLSSVSAVLTLKKALGADVSDLFKALEEIISLNEPYCIKMLAINGNDLIKLGYSGTEVGKVLNKITDFVIEFPQKNQLDAITEFLKNNK